MLRTLTQVAPIQALFDLFGGFAFLIWALYQVYAPRLLNRTTVVYSWVEEIFQKIDSNTEAVERVKQVQENQIQVQRAQARATDGMDEDEVDEYLIKNGVSVESFLEDES